jgi:hypothetical protein
MVVEKRQEPLQEDRPCVWTHPASGAIMSRAARGPATVYVTGKTLEHVEALTSPCLATHVPDRSHIRREVDAVPAAKHADHFGKRRMVWSRGEPSGG